MLRGGADAEHHEHSPEEHVALAVACLVWFPRQHHKPLLLHFLSR